MKTALKRLGGRTRAWWHLAQARSAIARCNRNVSRRRRIGVPAAARPRAPYFAPGVIESAPRKPRTGLRPYLVTLALALAAGAVYVLHGGLPS